MDLCKTVCGATPTAGGWADTLLASIWAYIVLLWVLMARCDRVAQLLWANMAWYKDAFTIFIPKSKSDQGGVRAFHKKLYCAHEPSVCPVLSCAVLFFSRTDYRSEFVFPRADTRRSGLRQLGQLIAARYSACNIALFGCNPLHIAWHHFKRGAFTFLGALADGPSWVGCKLRADQTVSDSSKPYLYQGSGQDGVIGRLLSLLPYGDPEFILGPPVLPSDVVVPWDVIVSDWDRLGLQFKHTVVPKFFAVIAFHYDWLRANLHASHPLFHSTLFTTHLGILLAAKAIVKRETLDMRTCTGVPLSVRTSIRIEELHRQSQVQATSTVPIFSTDSVHVPHVAPIASAPPRCLEPVQREALVLRMLKVGEYLPPGFRIPHYSCTQAWRAWWLVTDSVPLPLRFCAKKLPKTENYGAEATRYTRIKKVIEFISSSLQERDILSNPTLAFDLGWKNLQIYMASISIHIDAGDACSTVESKIRLAKAAAGIPKLCSLRPIPPLPNSAQPLHEAAASALAVFDVPNLNANVEAFRAAAAVANQNRDTNPRWPVPIGFRFEGSTQCFGCPYAGCDSLQKSEAMMTQHMDRHHDTEQRAQHFHFFQSEWCFRVDATCWCLPTGLFGFCGLGCLVFCNSEFYMSKPLL